jgi:hypothetical protein
MEQLKKGVYCWMSKIKNLEMLVEGIPMWALQTQQNQFYNLEFAQQLWALQYFLQYCILPNKKQGKIIQSKKQRRRIKKLYINKRIPCQDTATYTLWACLANQPFKRIRTNNNNNI